MPTGYTADIERDDFTFEDYALKCARAFGACVHQRDDPSSDRPRVSTDYSYHSEQLKEKVIRLKELESMNDEEIEEYGRCKKEEEVIGNDKAIQERQSLHRNYLNIMIKAINWQPPTDAHVPLKNFMIDQIEKSIEWDCDQKYYIEERDQLNSMAYRDFYIRDLDDVKSDIKYHKENLEKDRERNRGSNQWILDLYSSLNIPYE
jgi:hypothetical protein